MVKKIGENMAKNKFLTSSCGCCNSRFCFLDKKIDKGNTENGRKLAKNINSKSRCGSRNLICINYCISKMDRLVCEIDRIDGIDWRTGRMYYQFHISCLKMLGSIPKSIVKLATN